MKAAITVATTTASVGVTLANDRRLTTVFVEAAPPATAVAVAPVTITAPGPIVALRSLRAFLARRFIIAAVLGAVVVLLAASLPALTAIASTWRQPPAEPYGPPVELRAAAALAGNWEQSVALAAPPADQLGAAVLAGAAERRSQELADALTAIARVRDAYQAQQAQQAQAAQQAKVQAAAVPVRAAAKPYSLNRTSGVAPGTIIRARITIYGCTGPGGGFCQRMSSGGAPFPGAAACSDNLPFGTKLRIKGDPTGRTYECLDRGRLSATWVDVFFYNTTEGMAWQSRLGTTLADIEIVN